jgi:DNA-binding CsgD family transcriptional regulator
MAIGDERLGHGRFAEAIGRLRSPLMWLAAFAVAFFWSSSVLGIALALASEGTAGWWLVLPFGLVPLVALIVVVDRHGGFMAPRVPGAPVVEEDRRDARPSSIDDPLVVEELTDREREVLVLLSTGRTNGELARDLYIAVGTVKSHVNSICRKLGARNRTEAVMRARDLELVS